MLAGAVPVPVNTRFTEAEAAYVVEDSGAAYVFAPGDALPDGPPVEPGEDAAGGADLAAIFYTSGTTGVPKGAMQTHENLLGNAETALRVMDVPGGIGRELRTLIVVPLFHVTGCHSQLLVALQAGGTAVVDVAFDGPRMLETLRDEQITSCVAVPAIYHYITTRRSTPPRSTTCAGCPTAARRSRPRSWARSRRAFAGRASATASGRQSPRRSPRSCRTSGPASTPTPSASRRRTPR
jgi:acyl-CoA synthetase (AMP-forming)/AMP-acid ligase II